MNSAITPPLGTLNADEFLHRYWQKQPLLIRQAFPGFQSPISAEELAGLACEDTVESRIVLERDGKTHWALRQGPFTERSFAKLPPTHWTLLVQDVEKHVPALYDYLDAFEFLPRWRHDDLMISYAAPGGSVGPHVDAYDVFLLQAGGRRRWQIAAQGYDPADILPGTPLRILRQFVSEQEWILEPGDMLYLPPGVAHYGVAVDDCLTYSFGFRAPSDAQWLDYSSHAIVQQVDPEQRYTDPELQATRYPAEIPAEVLQRFHKTFDHYLHEGPSQLALLLGRFLSETKPGFEPSAVESPLTEMALQQLWQQGARLERNTALRFFYSHQDGQTHLFVDGRHFALAEIPAAWAEFLCSPRLLPYAEAQALWQNPELRRLMTLFYNEGYWLEPDEDA